MPSGHTDTESAKRPPRSRHGGGGTRPRYHGDLDLDGEGIRIAAYVTAKTPAVPWRMSAADYRSSVPAQGRPAGRVTDAPSDTELAPLMRTHGMAVFEELVVESLLDELHPRE